VLLLRSAASLRMQARQCSRLSWAALLRATAALCALLLLLLLLLLAGLVRVLMGTKSWSALLDAAACVAAGSRSSI
jgi:hypothetical protein